MCVTYGCTRCDACGYTQLGPRGRGPAKRGESCSRPAASETQDSLSEPESPRPHTLRPKRLRMCSAGILCCSDGSSLTVTSLSLFPIRCHSPLLAVSGCRPQRCSVSPKATLPLAKPGGSATSYVARAASRYWSVACTQHATQASKALRTCKMLPKLRGSLFFSVQRRLHDVATSNFVETRRHFADSFKRGQISNSQSLVRSLPRTVPQLWTKPRLHDAWAGNSCTRGSSSKTQVQSQTRGPMSN